MTSFIIDLLDASNNPIGDGPLQNVLSVSAEEKLDEAGTVSFTVPATDYRAATLIDQADRFRVKLSSGVYIYGIIEKDTLSVGSEQPTRTIVGANMLRELQQFTMGWWCFYSDSNLNTVILPDLIADTGWSLGTVDAGLGTLYCRFDGDTRLAALIKIANNTGKHFRLGSTFRTIDFGAFGSSSGVTFENVPDGRPAWDSLSIIKSLQVISDRGPVVNRIYPWGAGQDGGDTNRAKVSLFHLTPGDSRWQYIKCKPGVRGSTATVTAVGADGKQYITTSDTSGFFEWPITQLLWCYDPDQLNLGCGYDFVIDEIHAGVDILTRGSPVVPAEPSSFPVTLISNPQLYIEDADAYSDDPHEAVIIFSDVTLTDLSSDAFESAASQLYNRAAQYLATHKVPQIAYAVSVFNCPDTLHVGDTVHVTYSGAVTRNGVTINWVDIDTDLFVINITRQFNADGSTSATVEVSNLQRQPSDSTLAVAESAGMVGTHAITVGAPSVSSASGGGGGSGGAGDPLTFALPLWREINNVTLPLTTNHLFVGVANVATDVALSGDATLASSGALTLKTVNSNVGSYTNANITVNAKGLITAAANGMTSTDIYFNVKNYGAVGNGVTDDTTAVQNAYDAAFAAGGILLFPTGTYLLTHLNLSQASNDWNKHVRICGTNPQSSILKFSTTGVAIDCLGAVRLQFENLQITSGTSAPTIGILLARSTTAQNASDYSFRNVWVWGNFTQACVASIASEGNVWSNCKFYNTNPAGGTCFFTSGYDNGYKLNGSSAYASFTVASSHGTIYESANTANTFVGCHFASYGTENLCLSMDSSAQASFLSCLFMATSGPTSLVLMSAENAHPWTLPVLFSGCLFEADGGTHGIELYNPSVGRGFENLAIIGCEFNLYGSGQESLTYTGSYSDTNAVYHLTYLGNGRPGAGTDSVKLDYAQASTLDINGVLRSLSGFQNCSVRANTYDFLRTADLINWITTTRRNEATSKPVSGIYFKDEIVWNTDPAADEYVGWIACGYSGAAYGAARANSTAYSIGTWLMLPGLSVWEVTAGSGTTGGSPPAETGDIGDTVADGDYTLTKRADYATFLTPFARLYTQSTTGSSSATFTQSSGNAVNDASTFDGYTLAQVVKALRTWGVLA